MKIVGILSNFRQMYIIIFNSFVKKGFGYFTGVRSYFGYPTGLFIIKTWLSDNLRIFFRAA